MAQKCRNCGTKDPNAVCARDYDDSILYFDAHDFVEFFDDSNPDDVKVVQDVLTARYALKILEMMKHFGKK